MIGGIIKAVLGPLLSIIPGIFNAKEQTARAHIYGQAQVGTELARTAGVEAQARAEVQREQTRAGWWWLQLPAWITGMTAACHFGAVGLDSIFGFGWAIARLPAPMDEWQGAILLAGVGVGGGLAALGQILGRR